MSVAIIVLQAILLAALARLAERQAATLQRALDGWHDALGEWDRASQQRALWTRVADVATSALHAKTDARVWLSGHHVCTDPRTARDLIARELARDGRVLCLSTCVCDRHCTPGRAFLVRWGLA